jgi:hypothetical protein
VPTVAAATGRVNGDSLNGLFTAVVRPRTNGDLAGTSVLPAPQIGPSEVRPNALRPSVNAGYVVLAHVRALRREREQTHPRGRKRVSPLSTLVNPAAATMGGRSCTPRAIPPWITLGSATRARGAMATLITVASQIIVFGVPCPALAQEWRVEKSCVQTRDKCHARR